MTPQEAQAIRQKANQLKRDGLGGVSQQMREMIAYWKEHRPKMHKALEEQGLVEDFALTLDVQVAQAIQKDAGIGIDPSDSQRMHSEILLMTPEDEEDEETTT
jgi:hypothetical protein